MRSKIDYIYFLTQYVDVNDYPKSSFNSGIFNSLDPELLDGRLLAQKIIPNTLSKEDIAEIATHLLIYNDILYNKHTTSLIINLPNDSIDIDWIIKTNIELENFKNSNIFYISDQESMYFIDLRSVQKILSLSKITHNLKTTFMQQKLIINYSIDGVNIKKYIPKNFVWDSVFGV